MEKGGSGFSTRGGGAPSAPRFNSGGFESGSSISSPIATKSTSSEPSVSSMFKTVLPPKHESIVSIENGTGKTSPFARSQVLKNNNMVDISRPVKEISIEKHVPDIKSSSKAQKSLIIDIKHGKSEKPFFNRPGSLNQEKKMINLSRPIVKDPVFEHSPISSYTAAQRTLEEKGFSNIQKIKPHQQENIPPEKSENADPLKNTVIVWGRPGRPHSNSINEPTTSLKDPGKFEGKNTKPNSEPLVIQRHEAKKQTGSKIETKPQNKDFQIQKIAEVVNRIKTEISSSQTSIPRPESRTDLNTHPILIRKNGLTDESPSLTVSKSNPETRTPISHEEESAFTNQVKPEREVTMGNHTRPQKETSSLNEIIIIPEHIDERTKQKIRTDVEFAQKMISTTMEATGASHEVAQKVIVRALLEKHPQLSSQIKVDTEKRVLTEIINEKKTDHEIGKKIQSSVPKKKTYQESLEEKILYFQKDKKANAKRKDRIKATIARLAAFRKMKGQVVTGREVSEELSRLVSKDMVSEVSSPTYKDNSWDSLIQEIKQVDSNALQTGGVVEELIEEHTAVRLTFDKPLSDGASKDDAEHVYGGKRLNNVEAYVEEDHSRGELFEDMNGNDVYYITRKNGFGVQSEDQHEQK